MSLNMYLGSADVQTSSMNQFCIQTIQGMEEAIASIDQFALNMSLQGKAYQTAKTYMAQTFRPLAQGIIYLCEELIRQNDDYPSEFRSQVSTSDVIEHEIADQIVEINRLIRRLRELNDITPMVQATILIYEGMKRILQQRLEKLHQFNVTSRSNYDTAFQLADCIVQGLAQVQGGKGFNSETGTFSTKGMELGWVQQIHKFPYILKAHEQYGEHLEKYPRDVDKIIAIMKYEEKHTEYLEQTNEFLAPLEVKDIIEIKYLMYTAEEPYRTLAMKYLDEVKIASLEGEKSFFLDSDNSITYIVERDRTNARGAYFTFFHELGHAIDYNYAKEIGMDGFFSNNYRSNGNTLAEYMHGDVKNKIQFALKDEINKEVYDDIDMKAKTKMINNITESFIYTGPEDNELTSTETDLYNIIQTKLSQDLHPDEHHNASDVYGGVTLNEIVGKWGHHKESYWIDLDTGERTNEPDKEGFASYYGSIMIQDSVQIESVTDYLPNSKKHMNNMFKSMNEGVNK
ncbi:LXG domain of WXG superfamily protein [Evansella caseinilytica]|uniref:LXG domain of WXG superfamily protein n=1 Tax=Evansella caseinilytica TaxID=1503961 RepID=A0A1H3TTP4_9BACI|nr:hypothetical protein [Evansella caseinilytica]SDZ53181.1 LXG domain of WXG superfamily protein [Evansella caseinilytica]